MACPCVFADLIRKKTWLAASSFPKSFKTKTKRAACPKASVLGAVLVWTPDMKRSLFKLKHIGEDVALVWAAFVSRATRSPDPQWHHRGPDWVEQSVVHWDSGGVLHSVRKVTWSLGFWWALIQSSAVGPYFCSKAMCGVSPQTRCLKLVIMSLNHFAVNFKLELHSSRRWDVNWL